MNKPSDRLSTTNPAGISLRDYFAGLAMQAMIARQGVIPMLEKLAYQVADRMMEVRMASQKESGDDDELLPND